MTRLCSIAAVLFAVVSIGAAGSEHDPFRLVHAIDPPLGVKSPRGTSNLPRPARSAGERAYADRPDDVAGPQVHVLYVIPADRADRQLDTNGTVAEMLWEAQDWLAGRLEGQSLRVDTFQGEPDVTFYRSKFGHDALAQQVLRPLRSEVLETFARSAGDKHWLLFYEGTLPSAGGGFTCGYGGARVGVVNLHDDARCGARSGRFSYRSKVIAHEMAHNVGAVPHGSPTSDGAGHSHDSQDMMYRGGVGPAQAEAMLVDPGHDDYWHLMTPLFVQNHYPVQLTFSGVGMVTSETAPNVYLGSRLDICTQRCEMWFRKGATVRLVGESTDSSFRFGKWSGACEGGTACQLSIDGPKDVMVAYDKIVNVQVTVRGPGAIATTGLGRCRTRCAYVLAPRSRVSLRAIPARGSSFVRWDGGCVAAKPMCSLKTRHRHDRFLIAVFSKTRQQR